MERSPLFVGRKPELDRWKQVLADPRGQAVLVVGHPGMGKTLLVNEMARLATAGTRNDVFDEFSD